MIALPKFEITSLLLVVIAGLSIAVGVQEVRVHSLKTDLAKEQKARTDETNARLQLALSHKDRITELQSEHAAAQIVKDTEHAKKLASLEADRLAGAATVSRLRKQLATFTAGARRPGETDAAAAERFADRLHTVGGLLDEGVGLVEDGRAIVARRDAEVARLLEQIRIDRAACSAGDAK